jgi:CBS-domain-containing membrane protein
MPQWQIRDVLTTDVITAPTRASVAEIATMLAERRISAVPIVDEFDVVVGVVSWVDLRDKLDIGEPDAAVHSGWLRRWMPPRFRWPDAAAIDVMSAPPVIIRPDTSISAAARLMHQKKVGRLLVVDGKGQLVGIVTRRDLLKVHARLDAVIRDDVMQQVLRRILMIEPGAVRASVDDGLVTLNGRTGRRTTALAAVGLTETVPGVTGVVDRLTFDTDDTVAVPAARPPANESLHGWRIGRRRHQSGLAAVDNGDSIPADAAQVANSAETR